MEKKAFKPSLFAKHNFRVFLTTIVPSGLIGAVQILAILNSQIPVKQSTFQSFLIIFVLIAIVWLLTFVYFYQKLFCRKIILENYLMTLWIKSLFGKWEKRDINLQTLNFIDIGTQEIPHKIAKLTKIINFFEDKRHTLTLHYVDGQKEEIPMPKWDKKALIQLVQLIVNKFPNIKTPPANLPEE